MSCVLYSNTLTIVDVQHIVAKHYKINRKDMISSGRTRNLVLPRQIAMYLVKYVTYGGVKVNDRRRSLPNIGKKFGGRDHTTVIHAIRKVGELIEKNPRIKHDVETLLRHFFVEEGIMIKKNANSHVLVYQKYLERLEQLVVPKPKLSQPHVTHTEKLKMPPIFPAKIKTMVARYYGVKAQMLEEKPRNQDMAHVRNVLNYLVNKEQKMLQDPETRMELQELECLLGEDPKKSSSLVDELLQRSIAQGIAQQCKLVGGRMIRPPFRIVRPNRTYLRKAETLKLTHQKAA